ncbi:MAG TPA: hypothetical protein DCL40_01305 [Coxiellaceae bacterium]|nr:hypothetical protein [Coxiellaceae bacterium]
MTSFYESLEQAVDRGYDNSKQPVLKQVQKIMQSPISLDFFFKAFVISCDHPDYKNYVYLVDRDDVPKLTEHPDNPRVNIKGATWTNSKEDNEYIVTTLLDKPRDCLSAEWEELCFCFMYIAGMNLLVTPLIASLTLTQYSSMTPLLHAVRVSCMPLSFCNDACSFWISASVTIGLPIDCCLTGLYSLQLFDYCNWQDTPSFLVDETFNRFMGKIRSREAFALLFEDENSSNSLESSPALLFSQKPPSEIAKPSAMTMSR